MKICLHIGLPYAGAERLQAVLAAKRDQLAGKGILFARSPGNRNHTRLFMAVTDPDHVDPLRFNRGFAAPDRQEALRRDVSEQLQAEITSARPDRLILSASQLGSSLANASELERLKDLLGAFSDDIEVVAHIDEPARMLAIHYGEQVLEGRARTLDLELGLSGADDWWEACLDEAPLIDPHVGQFLETQSPPFWLDYPALVTHWERVFGQGSVTLRAHDAQAFAAETVTDEVRAAFGITHQIGKAEKARVPRRPSAATLARARQYNALLLQLLAKRNHLLPRPLWRELVASLAVPGPETDAASLTAISERFEDANMRLVAQYGLPHRLFDVPSPQETWREADPTRGFRASQYLLAHMWRIQKASRSVKQANIENAKRAETPLSDDARAILPESAIRNYDQLRRSRFAPHNRLGSVDEEQLAAPFDPAPARDLPEGSSGNVIVGCMKNEAPYIIEWVAYHRAIGFDNFLIYTNGCEDGTDEILDRLQEMGVLEHRLNDDWKGKSPQQFALNKALKEPVIRNAAWIAHIDVDEFVNVRCGNGTLQDFFEQAPDATNVAMTWRLFGHNGITDLEDKFVIDQFDTCAPKFCPKPHTAWGFKTLFKNLGAYEKMSCHRPNKLAESWKDHVKWVNGSGRDITDEAREQGWRSSVRSVGYDLLQLNHYALRSAESFLIKRQRGRALHVDRSIGLNYWIRMDWSVHRDVTIKRNLPRLQAEYDRLMTDPDLRQWHEHGLHWHRKKAEELHGMPEFADLYKQAIRIRLSETERVAYALSLDTES